MQLKRTPMPRDAATDATVTAPADPLAAFEVPLQGPLRRAGLFSVIAGLMWPLQALAIASVVQGWVTGQHSGQSIGWVVLFVGAGVTRALADRHAGGLAFAVADDAIARLRNALLADEARRPDRVDSSAALAALLAQKIPLLMPYLTRYRIAALRVMVLPPVFLVLAFSQSWAVGIVLLVAGPLIPVFMALVGMAAKKASEEQMVEIGAMNDLLIDRLAALGDLRLLDATGRAVDDLSARAGGLRVRTMVVLRVAFLSSTVLELFAAIGVAMVAVYVGFSLLGELDFGAWETPLTLGEGLFLLLLAPEFFQPLRDLAASWHDRAAAQAVAGEVAALTAAPRIEILGDGAPAAAVPGPMRLCVRGAVVQRGGRRVAVPDIDIGPAQAVVLTGKSGSGKSTALAAIAGLLPLASGRIEVAGAPLTGLIADGWRARLAWVPQGVHLPDATLRAFLDPRGTGRDLAPALAAARASHVVEGLSDGLETRLGETGAGVSGGEARRLLVARAWAAAEAGADLVLADEPTADLDDATAADVIAGLRGLRDRGVALIIASHDPAVIAAFGSAVAMEGLA
jgi:ATP-binding cassette subfamily C protein CydD